MSSQPEGQGKKTEKRSPPKSRSTIIRIFQALKRYENRRRRNTQHQINERLMARWTRVVGLFTAALFGLSIGTGFIFWRQLNVLQGQLDEMQAARRPSVTMKHPMPHDLDYDDTNGVSLAFDFMLRNTGSTPAMNVWVSLVAFPNRPTDVPRQRDSTCDQPLQKLDIGIDIFPGDEPFPWTIGTSITKSQVDDLWQRFPTFKPMIFPFVITCIIYRDTFGKIIHHTPFLFDLQRTASDNPQRAQNAIFLDEGRVHSDNLHLIKWVVGSGHADE